MCERERGTETEWEARPADLLPTPYPLELESKARRPIDDQRGMVCGHGGRTEQSEGRQGVEKSVHEIAQKTTRGGGGGVVSLGWPGGP